jgi:hypothetical protein
VGGGRVRAGLAAFVLVSVLAALWLVVAPQEPPLVLDASMDPDSVFEAVVVPVYRAQCEGCHFRGGEMYSTMPFDEPQVTLEWRGEIVTQLDEKGGRTVEAWADWASGLREEAEGP